MAIREELTLGIQNWKKNLDEARNDVRRFHDENKRVAKSSQVGGRMGGAGGLIAAAGTDALASLGLAGGITGLTLAVKNALTEADDLADLTVALNQSAEALQRVDFAAQQAASIGIDQVAKSMLRLERSLSDPENIEAAKAMDNLGISAERLSGMAIDEKVIAIAEAFQKARAEGTGLNDIQDLMGRTAADLVPLFEQGGDALRDMFERAPVMAEETVQQMARVNDEIDAMIEKSKTWLANAVGGISGIGSFVADTVGKTPGEMMAFLLDPASQIDRALLNVADQSIADQQAAIDREAKRKKNAEGQADNAAAVAREAAAKKSKEDSEALAIKNEEAREKRVIADRDRRQKESAAFGDARLGTLTPAEQMAALRRQIEESIGIGKAGNRGEILSGADALAKSGKFAEASEVLKDLRDLEAIAGRMPTGSPSATGAMGSFANLMEQIFGRGPQEQQLEEARRLNTLADDQVKRLDKILEEMKKPPTVSLFDGAP